MFSSLLSSLYTSNMLYGFTVFTQKLLSFFFFSLLLISSVIKLEAKHIPANFLIQTLGSDLRQP